MKKTALISVSDKTGIVEFAKEIEKLDYEIIATGNTAKILSAAGVPVKEISSLTGFPEVFDGRVKTLHPKIFGGILFRRNNKNDLNEADLNGITPIDIVCVNLYPFIKTAENPSNNLETIIENIDIGGPSLIRAAAKNYKWVSILTNPSQYNSFITELKCGNVSGTIREKLAVEAFSHTAHYDTYISNYLEKKFEFDQSYIRINYPRSKELRYGENPHQKAAIYGDFGSYFEILHGKEISYNNILDLIAGVELIEDLDSNSCAIIKHSNAAGASTASSPLEAYIKALKCDPASAFGGIVIFNSEVNKEIAEELNKIFLEIICAPAYSEDAVSVLYKKKDRRIVKQLKPVSANEQNFKKIPGGIIAQDPDLLLMNEIKVVTKMEPSAGQLEDLKFAWIIAKHTKSNAIVFVKDKTTLGVGAGQMSRVDSAKIAAMKAAEYGLDLTGSVAASDAFFPFADGLIEIINRGAVSVIQPGGSVRDAEVINAANDNNISMVFTGIRHFKH